MKITIIGAGSIFFTRQLVNGMVRSKTFDNVELGLVDTNPYKCEQMDKFCKKMVEDNEANIKITSSTDRKDILPGSDYVILSFAVRNYHYRETGTILAKTFGINLISGETTGPSSVFRILRTVPEILKVTNDIEKYCKDAYVFNYVNPTNVIGTLLDRHTKLDKAYAFCDSLYEKYTLRSIATYTGLKGVVNNINEFDFKLGGINHFTWLWDLKYKGEDMMEKFKAGLKHEFETKGPNYHNAVQEWDPFKVFGVWPACGGHNNEYMRYFKGLGKDPSRDYTIKQWELNQRINWFKKVWREIKACNEGKMSTKDVMQGDGSDMLLSLMESILLDKKEFFPVNIRNEGRIPNLPNDTIVEIFGSFGRNEIKVPHIGDLPRGPLGISYQIIDEQELALEAALTGNFNTVVKAVACDPAVMSLNDAIDISHRLMALEEEDLDDRWDPYWVERDEHWKDADYA